MQHGLATGCHNAVVRSSVELPSSKPFSIEQGGNGTHQGLSFGCDKPNDGQMTGILGILML
jgi:hypothetical protein